MKSQLGVGIMMAAMVGMFCLSLYAAEERIGSYKISVTIPVFIGLANSQSAPALKTRDNAKDSTQEIKIEKVVRNQEAILLNTFVAK